MASTAVVLFVLIVTMGSAGGIAGGEGSAGGGSGGEVMPPLGPAGGSVAGGERELMTTPGSAGGGSGGEVMPPPRPAGGSVAGGGGSGGGRGSATTTAGISASLLQEFGFDLDLGGNCSLSCWTCLLEIVSSCLADGLTCEDPLAMAYCYVGKSAIMEDCFDDDDTGSKLTTSSGSAGGNKLMTSTPAGSAGGNAIATTTTTPAGVSALLRQAELPHQLVLIGRDCDADCENCLFDGIWSCVVDGVICGNPLGLLKCFVEKGLTIEECFK
ncbi:unnamed protein product [Urochloa decumbens]|uniref:Uncharacterized protein n=1 Tax=Urochloa decumbens TaxID=240449 RepID=A0ABC9C512_9POAL